VPFQFFLSIFLFVFVALNCIITDVQSSSVSIVPRQRIGRLELDSRQATAYKPALKPTQPPIQCVLGPLSPEVRQLGNEVDYSPPPSAEVKNAWSCTSISPYVFMARCLSNGYGFMASYLVKHRDKSTFTYWHRLTSLILRTHHGQPVYIPVYRNDYFGYRKSDFVFCIIYTLTNKKFTTPI
jgi:hypothetical protein